MAAQGYQESQLDQSKISPRGAIGVMQLLPSTAAAPQIDIRDIERLENNIHAGVKYMRFIVNEYYKNEPMDGLNKGLFAFASYNAGPARVAGLRNEAKQMGLDPNRWFYNVELVAAKEIGRETVQYVSNIYKYYISYRRIESQMEKNRMSPKSN
jgi:membrane-bound lytic murein transglycosylase MltF